MGVAVPPDQLNGRGREASSTWICVAVAADTQCTSTRAYIQLGHNSGITSKVLFPTPHMLLLCCCCCYCCCYKNCVDPCPNRVFKTCDFLISCLRFASSNTFAFRSTSRSNSRRAGAFSQADDFLPCFFECFSFLSFFFFSFFSFFSFFCEK